MTTETSYNQTFAPLGQWAAPQAAIPQTTHNLPGTIGANSSASTSLIVTEGFSMISAGITVTQAGTLSIQRYLDASGTVPQGAAISTAVVANVAANLDVLDGKPFASFILTVSNSAGSAATISQFALVVQTGANDVVNVGGIPVSAINPMPVLDGYQNPVTVSWTNATAANTSFSSNTAGYDTVILTFVPTGSITAGAIIFEVYDGVNWMPVKAARIESYATEGGYTLSGSTRAWQIPVAGFPQFRARLSPAMTGTGTASLTMITSSAPDTSVVTVGVDPATTVQVAFNGTGADGSTTITTGGTAQSLFGGVTPTNGFFVTNPDAANDLWLSLSTTAAANGSGSVRLAANGGYFASEAGVKPWQAISIVGAVTGQKITAARW